MKSIKTEGIVVNNATSFWRETTSEAVYENRKKILEDLTEAADNCLVAVWLVEIENGTAYLSLSYTNGAPLSTSPNATDLIRVTEDELVGAGLDGLPTKIDPVLTGLDANGPDGRSSFHIRFDKFIQHDRKKYKSQQDVVGILSVLYEPKDKAERQRIQGLANHASEKLARAIEQGRMTRILSASKSVQGLLSTCDSVGLALKNSAAHIKTLISAEQFSVVRVGEPNWPGQISAEPEQDLEIILPEITNSVDCVRANLLTDEVSQSSSTKNSQRTILVPISESAVVLSKQAFTRLDEFDAKLTKTSISTHAILFREKNTSLFHAQIFSTTDVEVCEFSKRYIESYVSSRHYEDRIDSVRTVFEGVGFSYALSNEEIQAHLKRLVNSVDGSIVLNVENPLDEERFSKHCIRNGWDISDRYYSSLQTTYEKYVDHSSKVYRDEIRIGVEVLGNGSLLEIHFSGENTPARLLLIKLNSQQLAKNDLAVIKAFVSELHLMYKNFDAAEMRQSLLIQIRHAVIHAIAAAEMHMDVVARKIKLRRLSVSKWEKLRSDVELVNGTNKATWFIHEAVSLTDTGRYLFSDLNADSLRHDHVDPLVLINNTRAKFESPLKNRNLRLMWIDLPAALPSRLNNFVTADKLLMGIVYTNLIDNAIKYARRDSTISIRLSYLSDRYRFEITNIGDHLPQEIKPLIFRRFFRGQRRVEANRVHGTGIGLPVSKMILDAHWVGSNLDYKSTQLMNTPQDARTTFTFSLPYRIGKLNETPVDAQSTPKTR